MWPRGLLSSGKPFSSEPARCVNAERWCHNRASTATHAATSKGVISEMAEHLPDVMTLHEAALFLRISENTLRERTRRQEDDPERVPHLRIGPRYLFPRSVLERWMWERAGLSLPESPNPS